MNEFLISFIIFGILLTWCLIFRYSENGKVEGEPLGMPRGTVRALITLLLVAFPFGYLISGEDIPGIVINIIFVAVAFYFEARRSEREKLITIVNEIKRTDLMEVERKKEKKPLYLPKFSVRILMTIMIISFLTINWYGGNIITFVNTNTLVDLMIIIAIFFAGNVFRSIFKARERRRFQEEIANMDASFSEAQIIEKLMLKPNWWNRTGKNILSIIMLIIVIVALIFYSYNFDYTLVILVGESQITVVGILLLLVNAYYGFRE
ncbi:MAG: hypothetical protein ACFE9S_14105 [Candidatus Hermodarchaeota archaeon]